MIKKNTHLGALQLLLQNTKCDEGKRGTAKTGPVEMNKKILKIKKNLKKLPMRLEI